MKLASSGGVYQLRFERLVLPNARGELPKPTPEERQPVRLRLAKLAQKGGLADGALTDAEKALIEQRFREPEANPHASVPWGEAKIRLMAPFKR